jgi:hypothetical protein
MEPINGYNTDTINDEPIDMNPTEYDDYPYEQNVTPVKSSACIIL